MKEESNKASNRNWSEEVKQFILARAKAMNYALMAYIQNVAFYLASDPAGKITSVSIDVTCGTPPETNGIVASIPFRY